MGSTAAAVDRQCRSGWDCRLERGELDDRHDRHRHRRWRWRCRQGGDDQRRAWRRRRRRYRRRRRQQLGSLRDRGARASSGGGGIAGGNNISGTGGLSGDTSEVGATPASNTGTTSGTSAGQNGGRADTSTQVTTRTWEVAAEEPGGVPAVAVARATARPQTTSSPLEAEEADRPGPTPARPRPSGRRPRRPLPPAVIQRLQVLALAPLPVRAVRGPERVTGAATRAAPAMSVYVDWQCAGDADPHRGFD